MEPISDDAAFIRAIEYGIAQADAGQLIPHEEVVARIETLLSKFARHEPRP